MNESINNVENQGVATAAGGPLSEFPHIEHLINSTIAPPLLEQNILDHTKSSLVLTDASRKEVAQIEEGLTDSNTENSDESANSSNQEKAVGKLAEMIEGILGSVGLPATFITGIIETLKDAGTSQDGLDQSVDHPTQAQPEQEIERQVAMEADTVEQETSVQASQGSIHDPVKIQEIDSQDPSIGAEVIGLDVSGSEAETEGQEKDDFGIDFAGIAAFMGISAAGVEVLAEAITGLMEAGISTDNVADVDQAEVLGSNLVAADTPAMDVGSGVDSGITAQ